MKERFSQMRRVIVRSFLSPFQRNPPSSVCLCVCVCVCTRAPRIRVLFGAYTLRHFTAVVNSFLVCKENVRCEPKVASLAPPPPGSSHVTLLSPQNKRLMSAIQIINVIIIYKPELF